MSKRKKKKEKAAKHGRRRLLQTGERILKEVAGDTPEARRALRKAKARLKV